MDDTRELTMEELQSLYPGGRDPKEYLTDWELTKLDREFIEAVAQYGPIRIYHLSKVLDRYSGTLTRQKHKLIKLGYIVERDKRVSVVQAEPARENHLGRAAPSPDLEFEQEKRTKSENPLEGMSLEDLPEEYSRIVDAIRDLGPIDQRELLKHLKIDKPVFYHLVCDLTPRFIQVLDNGKWVIAADLA